MSIENRRTDIKCPVRRLSCEYVLIENRGDSDCEHGGILCCPVQEISHHDHLIFEIAGEDLHLMAEVSGPSEHPNPVLFLRLHIVLCAVGRDQENRHPAFADRFVEVSYIVLCPCCHGLFLLF